MNIMQNFETEEEVINFPKKDKILRRIKRFLLRICRHIKAGNWPDFKYNHGQAQGIIPTHDDNHALAECFIAVARRK